MAVSRAAKSVVVPCLSYSRTKSETARHLAVGYSLEAAPEPECWAFHLRLRRWHFPVALNRGRLTENSGSDTHAPTLVPIQGLQLNFIEQILQFIYDS